MSEVQVLPEWTIRWLGMTWWSWPPSDPAVFWVTSAAALFTGIIVYLNWHLWKTAAADAQRSRRQSELALVEGLMTEYDQMRDSIRELQQWKQRNGDRFIESFKTGMRSGSATVHAIDTHRHRVSRFFVRLRRLSEAGFLDQDIVRISLVPRAVEEVFLELVDQLDEAVCEMNSTPFGDSDRVFYREFCRKVPDPDEHSLMEAPSDVSLTRPHRGSDQGERSTPGPPKQKNVEAEEGGGRDRMDRETDATESGSAALEVFESQSEIEMMTREVDRMEPITPKRGSSWLLRVVAAGCLVAAGGLGWYAAQQVNLAQDLRVGLSEATARIELSEREAAMSRQDLEDARAQATIFAAPDLSSVALEAQPGARDARGQAFWSPTRGVVLAVSDIPPISSDRVYQLWFVIPPNTVSAGLLRVDDAGRIFETITVPEGSSPPIAIAVTIELEGGADSPTGDVLLLGRTDR